MLIFTLPIIQGVLTVAEGLGSFVAETQNKEPMTFVRKNIGIIMSCDFFAELQINK